MTASLNQPQFRTPEHARLYLERLRWPDGPICPHCGSISREHYPLAGKTTRPGLWKCRDCREPFTVTVGTVFERSKIPLNVWLQAAHLMCASKKGISSHQLHRMLGVTYKTAWFMSHRIREAMTVKSSDPMGGKGSIVEADETYWGTQSGVSKRKLRSSFNKVTRPQGGEAHKQYNKIVALVERGGKVRSFHVSDVTGQNLKSVLISQIHADTHLMTDSSARYNVIKREQPFAAFDQVNHSRKEFVRGNAHTNTVEGYFSILKRGLIGTYHHVGSQHLHRYTNEFDFRYNHRERYKKVGPNNVRIGGYTDAQRADMALIGIAGKRLTYRRVSTTA